MAYVAPSDKFNGELRAKKGETLTADVEFNWLTIKKDGNNILCLAHCNTEPARGFEKDGKKAVFPGLVGWVSSTDAESAPDKVSAQLLASLEEGKFYSGRITLGTSDAIAAKMISDPKKFELYAEDMGSFTEVEKPADVPETLEFPKAWGNGGGKKFLSPAERMEQKLDAWDALSKSPKLQAAFIQTMDVIGKELTPDDKLSVMLKLI